MGAVAIAKLSTTNQSPMKAGYEKEHNLYLAFK